MRIIKKKGFSLIELLAAIVIIGVISTIAIVAYTKYIEKAKEQKDKQNEETIIEAAKAYLNANIDEKPKTIGESTKITLHTLRDNNYLKEDIKNSKDESCMENSYVYVYKNGYTSYSYKGVLYCGNDIVKPDEELPKPVVKDFSLSDINDVNNASFSMTLHGNSDDTIGIESYNYSISVINKTDSSKTEMYNSGAIDGKNQKIINLKNISVKKYIDITDYNIIKISVVVRNNLGAMTEYTKEANFSDSKGPHCSLIEGEAPEGEWLNKDDLSKDIKRQITVTCNDEQGSGCLRKRFSKTWPNNEEKSTEYSSITITDNSKNKNKTDCRVRVNIDNIAPTVVVSLIGKTTPLIKIASDGEPATIEKTEYPSLHNGWINSNEYPNGLQFQISATDDIYLYRYTWETSGTESQDIYFEQGEEHIKNTQFNIELKDDGYREGVLTIYDRAGNTTKINIKADIDRTPPNTPTTNFYKWSKNDARPTSSSGLESYTPNTWSSKKIYTISSNSLDSLSEFKEYQYTTSGNTSPATNTPGTYRTIEARGTSTIKYRACDNAGNCSAYNNAETVKIDLDGPTVTCSVDSSTKKIKNVTVTDNQSQEKSRYYSITDKEKTYNWSTTNYTGGYDCGKTYYAYVKAIDNAGNETIRSCGTYSKGSCCSSSSPSGCKWTTVCRRGQTHLYFGDNKYPEFIDAGYARHGEGTEDRLYILEDTPSYTGSSGTTWIRVCATSFKMNEWDYNTYYKPLEESITIDGVEKKCYKLWVAKNCTGVYYNQLGQACSHDAPSACPG